MLTEIYIEALLVDEELADQVLELRYRDVVGYEQAETAWLLLVISSAKRPYRKG